MNNILVIYVGVAGIRSEDIPDYVNNISEKITPRTFKGEIILIPIHSSDTRIECINPKYITDIELINKHENLMKELNSNLQHQSDIIKKGLNEK